MRTLKSVLLSSLSRKIKSSMRAICSVKFIGRAGDIQPKVEVLARLPGRVLKNTSPERRTAPEGTPLDCTKNVRYEEW